MPAEPPACKETNKEKRLGGERCSPGRWARPPPTAHHGHGGGEQAHLMHPGAGALRRERPPYENLAGRRRRGARLEALALARSAACPRDVEARGRRAAQAEAAAGREPRRGRVRGGGCVGAALGRRLELLLLLQVRGRHDGGGRSHDDAEAGGAWRLAAAGPAVRICLPG